MMDRRQALTLASLLTNERMAAMPHAELYRLRDVIGDGHPIQEKLAPYEHRAFAREYAKENPLVGWGTPILSAGYQAAKGLGLQKGTRPSLSQLLQSIIGTYEGYTQ